LDVNFDELLNFYLTKKNNVYTNKYKQNIKKKIRYFSLYKVDKI
jgi:hypothetical protein